MASKADTLISDSARMIAASGISAVFALVYSSVYARLLTPSGYGEVAAALSISYLVTLAIDPIETAVTKLAATAHGNQDRTSLRGLHSRAMKTTVRLSLVGSLVWLLAAWLIKIWFHLENITLLALTGYLLLVFVGVVPRAILQGDQRFGDFGRVQVADAVVRLGMGLLFVALGLGPSGAVAGYAAGSLAALVYAEWLLRDLPHPDPNAPPASPPENTQELSLAVACFYFSFCLNADVLTAKHYLSPHDAGLYGAVNALSRMLYLIAIPIYQVLFSRVSALTGAGQSSASIVRRGLLLLAGLLGASCIIPIFFGKLTLSLVFGNQFVDGAETLQIVWLSTALLILQSAIGFVLIGMNRARGFVSLLIPCLLMMSLLITRHGSARDVAVCCLIATSCGFALIAGLGIVAMRASAFPSAVKPPVPAE
ncbi:MAG: oligosaccharide flippase family protein [Myxococcales bacterium]